MSLTKFLDDLSEQGIQLWVEGDRLRYRAPKDTMTPTLLADIKQRKQEFLQYFQNSETNYALSHGQQALWFLHELAPTSPAYNVAFAAQLEIVLDIAAFRRATQVLMGRHATLRTTFPRHNGEPVQQVHGYQAVSLTHTDVPDPTTLEQQMMAAYRQPLDLKNGPVFRVHLFSQSAQYPVVLLVMHHIVVDGWSLQTLVEELLHIYKAELNGQTINLPAPTHSYIDYVRWQADWLANADGSEALAYWREQLSGELPVLNLPTDRPHPTTHAFNGVTHPFQLPDSLSSQLKQLARTENVTLYMLLLAAFEVLLYRYTSQSDLLVGSPVIGRTNPEFENVVGYFVNPIVLRTNLSNQTTFRELLTQVQKTVLEALRYQEYPFPLLVELLRPGR
ncbi:MAG: non-ribosomal peptide synthetase, partial [Okeania sp. SIO3B3]|nr:non-ribosomal peptide synthetase [Okeania sp. SIO3B3]